MVMEKSKLERFINKYYLGGACKSVLYRVNGTTMSTRGISDDKNVLCEITAPSLGLKDGDYGVYDTSKLLSLMGVLKESLNVSVKKSGNNPVGITFDDGSTEATFVLADSSVIPNVPDVKKMPPFDMTIEMDELFINTFIKAKGALSEVDSFTVMSDGTDATAEVILGYSTLNTNRVKLRVTTSKAVALSPISFHAKYLSEILSANKDAKGGKLEISSKGIALTSFVVDNIKSVYYLVQLATKE